MGNYFPVYCDECSKPITNEETDNNGEWLDGGECDQCGRALCNECGELEIDADNKYGSHGKFVCKDCREVIDECRKIIKEAQG